MPTATPPLPPLPPASEMRGLSKSVIDYLKAVDATLRALRLEIP